MFGPSLSQDVHTMRFRAAVLAAGIDGIGSAGQLEAKIVFSSIRHGWAAATAAAAASLSSASTRRWMIHKSSRSLATYLDALEPILQRLREAEASDLLRKLGRRIVGTPRGVHRAAVREGVEAREAYDESEAELDAL